MAWLDDVRASQNGEAITQSSPGKETPGGAAVPVAAEVATAATPIKPFVAPRLRVLARPVTENFFGTPVVDPYRFMEDVNHPDVVTFMKGESATTRAILDSIPGRKVMEARINDLSQANVAISGVQVTGDDKNPRVFYYKLSPGVNSRKLYMRDGYRGAERMVFDPVAISTTEKRFAIDGFRAAPNGRAVVVAVAAGGSEQTSLRILEINSTTPRDTGVVIDRIGFANHIQWTSDSRSFFYNRLPPMTEGGENNRYLNSRAYRHVMGRPMRSDEFLLGGNKANGIALADIDIPSVQASVDGKNLIGRIEHGDAREISIFTAEISNTNGPLENISWRRIISPIDEVTAFQVHNNAIYLLTKKNAPRNKLVRMGLFRANYAQATTIVPHGDTVIAQIEVAQDGLYIRELFAGIDRLQRLNFSTSSYSGGKLEFVKLPFDLAIRQIITSPTRPGALLRLEAWTESPHYVAVEERSGNVADIGLHPKPAADFSNIVELRLNAVAKDGVKIPVSLMYRKGTELNQFNPTLIRAYGAYGIVQAPTFNPSTLAWLERGGILATCHVRGGGEFGEEWHRGGQKLTKANTWRDLIACSEFLIERGFTRKERLGIQGGSAGGITVGRALTERPDLFAAAVPTVGVMDAMRMEFTPNGPPNIPEFGSVKTEPGFRGLLAMSALHQVKDGVRYPAVMLMHGVNDPRVEVWQSTKMAARLQAATRQIPDANPVLLRLDYDAGHGVGSTRNQRNAELADVYSFLLWQFREPGFQPVQ